ncbi:MAG: threonine synthase, partial [bacterium]
GVTLGVTKKLIAQGIIPKNERIVVSITGNGLKTQEALQGKVAFTKIINAKLPEFEALVKEK